MRTLKNLGGSDAQTGAESPAICAEGLLKSFGPSEALRGVDLSVQTGEILAIMGPSGSGKSTLMHCLAGIITPDAGRVEMGSQVVSQMNERERSRLRLTQLGFVFQFGQLLPELSAADNVALPLMLAGTSRRRALETAHSWLERLGLASRLESFPGEMSGGQAQRVAIARALAPAPKILFADEPTGSLDSLAAEEVMRIIVELSRENQTTVVLVTHDARTAAYADRDVTVRDGRISGAPGYAFFSARENTSDVTLGVRPAPGSSL